VYSSSIPPGAWWLVVAVVIEPFIHQILTSRAVSLHHLVVAAVVAAAAVNGSG